MEEEANSNSDDLLDEFSQLGYQKILSQINEANQLIYDVLMGYEYDTEPVDGTYYPMLEKFNAYDKLEQYFSKCWAKGFALDFLNEYSYYFRLSDKGYYCVGGDLGITPDPLEGQVTSIEWEGDLIKVNYQCACGDEFVNLTAWFTKKDNTWKLTTPNVSQLTRADIKIEQLPNENSNRDESVEMPYYETNTSIDINVDKAREIAMRGYPSYINWSDGEFDEDTYGNPAYVFYAINPENSFYYAVFVHEDGSCYAHYGWDPAEVQEN